MSLRGAVSIARRLQDPLAELVKIDPKSIGVGQYQHDVTGTKLERSLDAVVEDAVNAVGVDVNTASAARCSPASPASPTRLAGAIVAHRDASGRVRAPASSSGRAAARPEGVRAVRGLPAHPRRRRPARRLRRAPGGVPGGPPHPGEDRRRRGRADRQRARRCAALSPAEFTDEAFGLPTVNDILKELEKPGRDPRPEFQTATFAEGVHTLGDLEPGMVLEGVVTNVAAFGAFVDIGVHQDGLVHVSAMSDNFVADPREVAKSGDVVKVKVLSVDIPRNRISLTMRLRTTVLQDRGGSPRGPRPSSARTEAPDSRPAPASPARGAPRGGPGAQGARPGAEGRAPGGDRRGGRTGHRDRRASRR